jgi:hypothetical protein
MFLNRLQRVFVVITMHGCCISSGIKKVYILENIGKSLNLTQLHIYLDNISINLFTEYAYLWELKTLNLILVKCCISTPLHNYKYDVELHIDRSSGKLIPTANYNECKKSNEKIPVHWSRKLMTSQIGHAGLVSSVCMWQLIMAMLSYYQQ